MGRTNIDIDDELVSRVMRRYALRPKRAAVDRLHAAAAVAPERRAARSGTGQDAHVTRVLLATDGAEPAGGEALARYVEVDRPAPADRPWVLANFVTALDGSVAVAGKVGELSSPIDQELFGLLRSLADVVLVGAGTVRAEGYGPARLTGDRRKARIDRGQGAAPPPIAVVSRSLDLDLDRPLFTKPERRTIVVTSRAADVGRRAEIEEVADVVEAGDIEVDLTDALAQLRERGTAVLLTEGGPLLLRELLAADLVDELCLTLAPRLGGDPLHLLPGPLPGGLRHAELDHVMEANGQLLLRYLLPKGRM